MCLGLGPRYGIKIFRGANGHFTRLATAFSLRYIRPNFLMFLTVVFGTS